MSYGIDTIKVGYTVHPGQIDFNHWTRTKKTKIDKVEDILVKDYYTKEYRTSNGTMIFLKYIPKDYRKRNTNMLIIEFSLPKLIKGNNYEDITDLDLALDDANATIAMIEGIPPLPDIRGATLHRIDLCASLQVGEKVSEYISALGRAQMPRREARYFSNTGVHFKSSEITTSLYDKEKECRNNKAHGILRFEITIRRKRKVNDYLGMKLAKLGIISFDLIKEHIQTELTTLSLDKPIQSDRSKVESILVDAGIYKGMVLKLLGYWDARQTMTQGQMETHGYTKRSMRNYEKFLTTAGISINGNLGRRVLPELTTLIVGREETLEKYQNMSCTPSDTRRIDISPENLSVRKTLSDERHDGFVRLWFLALLNKLLLDEGWKVFIIPKGFTEIADPASKLPLNKSPPR